MSIVMTGDVEGFFGEAVDTALSTRRVEASAGAREYVVAVLVSYAGRGQAPQALDRPVTLLLDEALHAPPSERFEKLKGLGDSSLCVSGLFQDHLERRGIDPTYVSSVGRTAYGSAATLLTRGDGGSLDLFGELASKFDRFVAVLHEVADVIFAGHPRGADGVLRLYERWQKTGSERLRTELLAQGLVPMRKAGGLS